jgi:hypothetical protein
MSSSAQATVHASADSAKVASGRIMCMAIS